VHEQREHRQDDADGRGQLEFAFEEHLIVSSLYSQLQVLMKGSKVSVLVGRRYPGLSQILNKLQSRDNKQGTYFARREPMCVALRNNILS
jgi:hypothetical protein